jgi:hypothetical protein
MRRLWVAGPLLLALGAGQAAWALGGAEPSPAGTLPAVGAPLAGRDLAQSDAARADIVKGDGLKAAGDLAGALAAYERGLVRLRRLLTATPGDEALREGLATTLDRIALVLDAEGKTEDAAAARALRDAPRACAWGLIPLSTGECGRPVENRGLGGARRPTASAGTARSAAPANETWTLPQFPWPPARPSAWHDLNRTRFLASFHATRPSLYAVSEHIIAALEAAGYAEYSLYAVPGGFAVVARLERMDSEGRPVAESLRFLPPETAEPFSLTTYIQGLFFAPEGDYRQIVFLVTPLVIQASGPAPTEAQAETILWGGGDRLPDIYKTLPFTDDDQVTALIYEFHKGGGARDVKTRAPGHFSALTHLQRSGLYAQLMASGRR